VFSEDERARQVDFEAYAAIRTHELLAKAA
jgi:hypothetical protein